MTTEIEIAFGPLEKFTERRVVGLILGAAANLTEEPPLGTPVDTGFTTNNWVASLDRPFEGVDGSPEGPSTVAQAAGLATVAAGYHLPQVGYIANSSPAIGPLNEGHSQQSPAGFIEAALLRAVREEASKP